MNVEFTGRHYEITPTIRKEVETGLTKIRKILGDKFETKVILAVEKHRHKAEITISPRNGPLVGLAQARDMNIRRQRSPRPSGKTGRQIQDPLASARNVRPQDQKSRNGTARPRSRMSTGPDRGRHVEKTAEFQWSCTNFPAVAKTTEVHLVRSEDAVAMRPMTLEEAIKEAHFRDRDVFVFRDPKGKVMVLHRTRDGKMELIEAP